MTIRKSFFRVGVAAVLAVMLAASCSREEQVPYSLSYTVSFDTAAHYLDVNLAYEGPGGDDLVLNLPRWTPGYYEIMDYAKHLCDFQAEDSAGKPVPWQKEGMNRWRVSRPSDGRLTVTYRIFADQRDVASSRVNDEIAFIAPAGVFMHVDGETAHPVNVCFELPDDWHKLSSGLLPQKEGGRRFAAPDFDTLYDSPFLAGNFLTRRFDHEGRRYDFAIETPDGLEESGFESDFCRIVSAASRLMGDVPYENYCLIHMGAGGGGLEHWNSQACYTGGNYRFSTRRSKVNFLSFVAHEYFHLYNVKCIRPAELWPFDYDREAVTPMLWVSEGLTCYYEFRLLRDSGIATPDESLEQLSKYFGRYAPFEGQRHMSLRESSYDIWLNFMNRDSNVRNVRTDYYYKGPVVGLLMDIDIRRATGHARSLDDVMRLLYRRFYQERRCGFTEEDFWEAVAEVAGRPVPHLRRLVDTTEDIDYASYLEDAGLFIDKDRWSICRIETPMPSQEEFLRRMNLL